MTSCQRQSSGDIELYFYGELEAAERSAVERHLRSCADCRQALEELSTFARRLPRGRVVDAPPDGDWSGVHAAAGRRGAPRAGDGASRPTSRAVSRRTRRRGRRVYLAMAALLTLVTSGVAYVARSTSRRGLTGSRRAAASVPLPDAGSRRPSSRLRQRDRSPEAAFAALSEQHFERSKLVVLGLANKDAHHAPRGGLGVRARARVRLLSDTRLYRQAAEAARA